MTDKVQDQINILCCRHHGVIVLSRSISLDLHLHPNVWRDKKGRRWNTNWWGFTVHNSALTNVFFFITFVSFWSNPVFMMFSLAVYKAVVLLKTHKTLRNLYGLCSERRLYIERLINEANSHVLASRDVINRDAQISARCCDAPYKSSYCLQTSMTYTKSSLG